MEMKDDESQTLRLRVDQISSKLDKQDRVRAVNTKWMLTVGAAIVAALGYTNFVQLPKEAARAAREQVGPEIVDKANLIVDGLKKHEDYAQKVRAKLGTVSELEKIANLPIGTIIASMLEPSRFAEAVGDPNRTTWVLADGEPIAATSRYAKLSTKTKTPDLRGVFLRGMNVNGGQDPNNYRESGDYQPDALQEHGHQPNWTGLDDKNRVYEFGYTRDRNAKNAPEVSVTNVTGEKVSKYETRPKNVAVYFYIKIN